MNTALKALNKFQIELTYKVIDICTSIRQIALRNSFFLKD